MHNFEKNCQFASPYQAYQGAFSLRNLLLDANLQEFSQQLERLSALVEQDEIPHPEAIQALDQLYAKFNQRAASLGIEPEFPE